MNDIQTELMNVLYNIQNPELDARVRNFEEKTSIKREQFVYGFSGFIALYLMFGSEAGLLCNLICFVYPSLVTIQVIEKKSAEEANIWLTYWITYGSISLTDFYAYAFMRILPIYWLSKALYCIYLYLPQTRGAEKLYSGVLGPLLLKMNE